MKNSYTIPTGTMGRKRRDGNNSPLPQDHFIQDSEGNVENGYPVSNTNKTKINDAKEPNYVCKDTLKEDILQVITKNFMEMILDMVNQNVQEALKKFQDTKNKEYEKTQKQVNEIIGSLNKHQSETENTINREINELKMKIDNIKEEVNHDIENLRKKNETETQNTMEGHSSRLEQEKTESQNLKIKWKFKEKLISY
jgi:hypothetical protein